MIIIDNFTPRHILVFRSFLTMYTSDLILLVEDNEDDVFIMQNAVKRARMPNRLFVAEDGRKASDYLTRFLNSCFWI